MVEDEDWDFDENVATSRLNRIQVMVLVIVIVIGSMGSYILLRDNEDEFPSKAMVPNLRAGMDWWYHIEENSVDHQSGENETEDLNFTMISVNDLK